MERLLNTSQGKVIISVMWGLGLAMLFFRQTCRGTDCIVYSAPPLEVEKDIYSQGDSGLDACYQFVPYNVNCKKSNNVIPHRN